MKLNNRGWGYRMMTFLICILVAFLLVAVFYIYRFYNQIKDEFSYNFVVVSERVLK